MRVNEFVSLFWRLKMWWNKGLSNDQLQKAIDALIIMAGRESYYEEYLVVLLKIQQKRATQTP